jgi:hypothetical protein
MRLQMNEELMALSRRAIACTNWRWMPGMIAWRLTWRDEWVQVRFVKGLDTNSELADPDHTDSKKLMVASGHSVINGWNRIDELLPNLTDPATLGCLLILVREAWKDLTASTAATKESDGKIGWVMDCWEPQSPLNGIGPFSTEIEALVSALEAAP